MGLISSLKEIFLGIESADATLDSSAEKKTPNRAWRLRDIVWWPVETEELAKRAVFACLIFSCYYAAAGTFETISRFSFLGVHGHWLMVDIISSIFFPGIFVLIALGLFKLNRIAAIAGFVLSLFSIIWASQEIITGGSAANWRQSQICNSAFLAFVYLHGIRGVSAYKCLSANKTSSTVSES